MSRIYEALDEEFAEKCNRITLYSHTEGFFKNLFEDLIELAKEDNWLESFENEPDDDKIKAVLKNEMIMKGLKEVFSRIENVYHGKDIKVSIEKRKAAEAALKDGDIEKSLALACQAVLRSPMKNFDEVIDGGVPLAFALWLRSDILMRMNRHHAAAKDLVMALKECLPAKMRPQYYWRIADCYKVIGDTTRAKICYEITIKLLDKDEAAKKKLQEDLDSLNISLNSDYPENDKDNSSINNGAAHSKPSLSHLVKITEDETKGRYAVADKPIRPGDVVLVDKPYAACLLPSLYCSHCLNCFKRLEDCVETAPVWCPTCSGVAFCNNECRDEALLSYHKHECKFLGLFIGSGMSMLSYVALRMVSQTDLSTNLLIHTKYIKKIEDTTDLLKVMKKKKGISRSERLTRSKIGMNILLNNISEDEFRVKRFEEQFSFDKTILETASQIYKLCTHSKYRKGDDYLKRIVMAMFLTECLKRGDYFKDVNESELEKVELSICELLVFNLQLLQFNAHEVYETVRGQHMFTGSKHLYTAVGIYPTGALFNHDCCPSVARYFNGRDIVLRATRPIKPGEMVAENYGPHFMVMNREQRQKILSSRYWFTCDCAACKENWPIMKLMKSTQPLFRCPNTACSAKILADNKTMPAKCSECSTSIDIDLGKKYLDTVKMCLQKYEEGANLMEEQRPMEASKVLCDAIDQYYKVAHMPHRETLTTQDSLRCCFAITGNVHIVKKQHKN